MTPNQDMSDFLDAIASGDFERRCRRCGSMIRWAIDLELVRRGVEDEPMFVLLPAGVEAMR
jgi:hypothetical protein